MMGAFANSLLFVCSLLVATILTLSVLAYTARHVLVVVVDTSGGIDRVRWPNELLIDWLLPSLRLFGVVAVLLIPCGIALRAVGDRVLPDDPALRTAGAIIGWLWLVFPIGLLSALSEGSIFAVVRWSVLQDLLRVFPALLWLYLASAAVFVGVVALWGMTLFQYGILLVPVACLATGWGILVYARLLGRLAWLTGQLRTTPRKRPAGKLKPTLRKQLQVTDPWAVPAAEKRKTKKIPPPKKPAAAPADGSYVLSDDPPCRPPKFELIEGSPFLEVKLEPAAPPSEERSPDLSRFFADDDDEGSGAGGPIQLSPGDAPAPEPKVRPDIDVTPSLLDLRLAESDDGRSVPARPMLSGVFTFPFYGSSLAPLIVLSLSWLLLYGALRVMAVFFPF